MDAKKFIAKALVSIAAGALITITIKAERKAHESINEHYDSTTEN